MPIYVTKDGTRYDLPESKVKTFLEYRPDAQLVEDVPYHLRNPKMPIPGEQEVASASPYPVQAREANVSTTQPKQATTGVFDITEYPEPEVPEFITDAGLNPYLHESTFADDPTEVLRKERQREQSNREREIKGAYRNKYLLENVEKVAADPAAVEFLNGAVDDDDLNERWNKVLEPGFVKTKDYHLMNAELDAKGDGGKFYENVFNAYRNNKDLFRDRNDDASKAKMDYNARSLYESNKKDAILPRDYDPALQDAYHEAMRHNKALNDDLNDFLTNTEIGRAYASAHEQHISDLSKEINPLIKQGEKLREKGAERGHEKSLTNQLEMAAYAGDPMAIAGSTVGNVLSETSLMNKTINMLKEANRVIDAEKGRGAFWKGALPTRESLVQFLSFTEFINDAALVHAIDKHEKDPESLTEEEKFAIEAKHVYDQVVGGIDPGMAYNIGKGARDSASFMRDFILTGAAGRLASGAVQGAVKGIARRTGADFLLSRSPSWVSKLGKGVIDLTVRPATQTILMPSSYAMAFKEMEGVSSKDEDGNIVFSDRGDFNLIGAYDESQSEVLGEVLIEPLFARMGIKAPKFLRRQFTRNLSRATGIQSPIPEYLEEKYEEFKSILRGQGALEDFFDPRQNLETLGVVGVIQMPFMGVNAIGYSAGKYRDNQMIKASNEVYEKATAKMNALVGEKAGQVQQFINEVVETGDESLIKSAMLSVVTNNNITPEARRAIIDYTEAASMKSGLERAKQEHIEEEEKMVAKGGELYQRSLLNDKSNVLTFLNARLNYLEQSFPEAAEYTWDNVDNAIRANFDFNGWVEYNRLKKAREGVIQELGATIDTYLAPQVATLNEMAREDGTITELTMMGDEQSSFLVEGNIVLNENGFVDRGASDPILVVKNNEGKKKQVPISHVEAVNVQNLQESVDALTNEAYEKYARPLANKLDGVREFKPNEQVEYVDDKGKARAGVITTVSDKTVGVTDMATGKVETLEKSDLQARIIGERLQIRGQEYRPGDKVPVLLDGEQFTANIVSIEDGKVELNIEDAPSADMMFADLTPEELENIMVFPRSEPVEVDKTSEIEAENEVFPAGETQQKESEQLQNDIHGAKEEPQAKIGDIERVTEEKAVELVELMKGKATPAPMLELTHENWIAEFGTDGIVETPLGDIKMGGNQYSKIEEKGRVLEFGMIKPTLTNPDVIIEEASGDAESDRHSSYLFVKTFDIGGKKIRHYESVTINRDNSEVVISSHYIRENQLLNKLRTGKLLYLATELNASGQTFSEQPAHAEPGASFEGKDKGKQSHEQAEAEKIEYPRDKEGNVDYNKIDDDATYLRALSEEFGEESVGIVEEYMKGAESALKAADKVKDPIKRRREQAKRKAELDRWKSMYDSFFPTDAIAEAVGVDDVAPGEAVEDEQSMLSNRQKEEKMGEYVSLQDFLLRNIGTGRLKFVWSGKHGLASEILASRNKESERKKRIAFLNNQEGFTPETMAEHIIENHSQDIPEFHALDMQDIRNAINDVLLSYDTPTSMINAASDLRGEPTSLEEYMMQNIDPNELSDWEYSLTLPEEEAPEISQQELELYYYDDSGRDQDAGGDAGSGIHTAVHAGAGSQGEVADKAARGTDQEVRGEGAEGRGTRAEVAEPGRVDAGDDVTPDHSNEDKSAQKEAGERARREGDLRKVQSILENVGGENLPPTIRTLEDFKKEFEKPVKTPINEIKVGESVFRKIINNNRSYLLGAIRPTLENPDFILKDTDGSFLFVKIFNRGGSKNYNIVAVNKNDILDSYLSSVHIKTGSNILNKIKSGAELFQPVGLIDENKSQNNSSPLSESKDNAEVSEKQESKPKFTGDIVSYAQDIVKSHEIAREAEKVDTQPTDGQKEAGNYQKGHVKVQGFDITIENPRGSVRSGVDADGKAWETTMNNHYGYFKRSQGKDGDQIDVFIGDNPTSERVFVIDQVNPETGEFDESKVMLGFTSPEEAKDAYMSNYEEGWQGFGNITEVGVDDFKKWLYDGAKQRKPFSEYAGVKERQVEAIEEQPKQDHPLIEKARRAIEKDTKRVAIEKEVRAEVERLQKEFNTPIIIHEDLTTVDRKTARAVEMKHKAKERAPGWYIADTGTVHVYLPDTKDVADVQKTFFHEVVGHKGLRELLGDRFDEVMADFFDKLPENIRDKEFDYYRKQSIYKNKTDAEIKVLAGEEIISRIAESGDFESTGNRNIIQKLIDAILDWFDRNGISIRNEDAATMADRLLRESAENLRSQAEAKVGAEVKAEHPLVEKAKQAVEDSKRAAGEKQTIENNEWLKSFYDEYPNSSDPVVIRSYIEDVRDDLGNELKGKGLLPQSDIDQMREAIAFLEGKLSELESGKQTALKLPLKNQWDEIKSEYPDAIILFESPGADFEIMFDDVEVVRSIDGLEGVTFVEDRAYIKRPDYEKALPSLVRNGKRVAIITPIGEQANDSRFRFASEEKKSNFVKNKQDDSSTEKAGLDNARTMGSGSERGLVGEQQKGSGIYSTVQAAYTGGSKSAVLSIEEREELESRGINPDWDRRQFLSKLRDEAKKNNVWLDNTYLNDKTLLHDQKARQTSENDVYLNADGETLTKLNNLSYVTSAEHERNLFAFIDRIDAHNNLFPNVAYNIVGFMDNKNGNTAMVLEQPYIRGAKNATQEEINAFLQSKGFKLDGKRGWSNEHPVWTNGKYELFDARPANVLKGEDGSLYFIDVIPHSVDYMSRKEPESTPLFRAIGEIGASRLEGAEMVMDDLRVAREMEAVGNIDRLKDIVLNLFHKAAKGDIVGKPIKIGDLTSGGQNYLSELAGVDMKPYVSFVVNPSDLRHIYNEHYDTNEKDKGQNHPLTDEDIRNMVDVILHPEKIVSFNEDGITKFIFLAESPQGGAYNLVEVYGDRRGNLSAKSLYNTKKDVSHRAMTIIEQSKLSTSKTSGAILSETKVPNLFESAKSFDAKTIRLATGWERGVDGKWRYEVADENIHWRGVLNDGADKLHDLLNEYSPQKTIKLFELYENGKESELFKAYPELLAVKVRFGKSDGMAHWDSSRNEIVLERKYFDYDNFFDSSLIQSVLIHETQHAIQEIEGFAKGGDISISGNTIDAYNYHKRNADDITKALVNYDKTELGKRMKEAIASGDFVQMATVSSERLKDDAFKVILDAKKAFKEEAGISYDKFIEGNITIEDFAKTRYNRLAGEVEARNVQRRLDFTPEQRRERLLEETEDVARAEQIILRDAVNGGDADVRFRSIASEAARPLERLMPKRGSLSIVERKWEERKVMKHVDMRKEIFDNGVHNLEMPKGREIVKPVKPLVNVYNFAYSNYRSAGPEFLQPIFRNKGHIGLRPDRNGYPILNVERAKKFKRIFNKNINAYEKFLQYSKYISTEAAQREINGLLDDIDYARWYYSELADGKDVWRTENDPRFRTVKNEERRRADELMDNADDLRDAVPDYSGFLTSVYQRGFTPEQRKRVNEEARGRGWTNLDEVIEREMAEVEDVETLEYIAHLLDADLTIGQVKYLLKRNVDTDDGSIRWRAREAVRVDDLKGDNIISVSNPFTDGKLKAYEKVVKSKGFRFIHEHFDDMHVAREYQKLVLGKDWYEVTNPRDNAYVALMLSRSRSKWAMKAYNDNIYKPLIVHLSEVNKKLNEEKLETIKSDLKGNKSPYMRATVYAMAKSGLKRMEIMARRDADEYKNEALNSLRDIGLGKKEHAAAVMEIEAEAKRKHRSYLKRDVSGLTGLAELVGRKEENFKRVAESIVKEVEGILGKEEVDKLWDEIFTATQWANERSFEAGKMSKEEYERRKDRDAYYLPHRGYDMTTAADMYDYRDRDDSNFDSLFLRAKGRLSLAEDPFAHIASMAASAVLEAEKNKAKVRLYRLAASNPTDVVTIRDAWIQNVGTKENPDWREVYPDIDPKDNPNAVRKKIDEFETRMSALSYVGKARRKRGSLKLGVPIGRGNASEHAIRVWIGGEEKVMYVNGNPLLAQAINGVLNKTYSEFDKKLKKLNRWMSSVYTSLNPEFAVSNGLRDMHAALAFGYAEQGAKYSSSLFKNMFDVTRATANYVWRGKFTDGKNGELFEEFLKNGGPTGFTLLKSIEDYEKDVREIDRRARGSISAGDMWRIVTGGIDRFNQMIEINARFATYVTSRNMGKSAAMSAYDAKNITLNFERHGAFNSILMKYMSKTIVFSNAALQGIYRMHEAFSRNPKRMAFVLGSHMGMGLLNPFITALMIELFGDDDDKEKYDGIPIYKKCNNLVIYVGNGKYIMYPLSHEFRWIHGLGVIAAEWAMGNLRNEQIPELFVDQMTSMLPVEVTQGMLGFLPTSIKAPAEIMANENFMGRPIYKKNAWNELDPEWTKAYGGTWDSYVNLSKKINELTGGDDVKKGWVEDNWLGRNLKLNNPAAMQHLTRAYLGGGVDVLGNTIDVISAAAYNIFKSEGEDDKKEVNMSRVPFLRRVAGESTDSDVDYALRDKMNPIHEYLRQTSHLKSGYYKNRAVPGYAEKYGELVKANEDYAKLAKLAESLKKLKTNLNEEERREDERKIQEEMIKIYWGDPEDNRGTRLIKKVTGK